MTSEQFHWTIDTVETGDLSDGDLMSTITYIATDACGNSSESEVVVNILDTQPPYLHELSRRSGRCVWRGLSQRRSLL